jgi:hypothetical protein
MPLLPHRAPAYSRARAAVSPVAKSRTVLLPQPEGPSSATNAARAHFERHVALVVYTTSKRPLTTL